jgi:hypothetical protein
VLLSGPDRGRPAIKLKLGRILKIAVVVGAAMFLSGCDEGEEHALAQCELSALPTYKDATVGLEYVGYRYYISTCMKVAGFKKNSRPNKCTSDSVVEFNPYCYSPIDNLPYLFWRVRITIFDGGLIGQEY